MKINFIDADVDVGTNVTTRVLLMDSDRTPVYIEDITRWREDMNFIFEWQNNILRTSAASE